MRAFGLVYTNLEKEGYQLPLLESYCRYYKASVYDDILEIEAKVKLNSIGSKLRFDYNVFRDEELIASGHTTHIFMKVDTQRAVKPPDSFIIEINKIKKSVQ
jgi:acyl-CoA thioester hydrolase